MNILFLTIAWPKHGYNLYSDLMEEFAEHGHNVYVAAANEKRNGSKTYLTKFNGINVLHIRCGNITKVKKMEKVVGLITLDYIFKRAISTYWGDLKFDFIVMSTPPVNLLGTYKTMKKRYDATTYLLLKDIWPQGPADLGAFKVDGIIYKYFRKKEKKLYDYSDFIGCMSEKNIDYLLKHNINVDSKKVEVNPNSIKPRYIEQSFEEQIQIREKYAIPVNKTVFIYGGNLGEPQGVEFIEECIRSNETRDNTFFLIVGSGTKFMKLKKFFDDEKPRNALIYESLPKDDYEALCKSCDIGLIYLSKKCTIPHMPSRLLSYMQNGMPVLVAAGEFTDVGDIVQNNNFGYSCDWGDIKSFDEIVDMITSSPKLIKEMGFNSKKYLDEKFTVEGSYKKILKRMEPMHMLRKQDSKAVL